MSHRYIVGALALILFGLGAWVLAQQDHPAVKDPGPATGQFTVSPAGSTAVLLETKSSKTWVLHRSELGDVWLPAKRIDSEEEALKWREGEDRIKTILGEERRHK